jgi:hypothetical protein
MPILARTTPQSRPIRTNAADPAVRDLQQAVDDLQKQVNEIYHVLGQAISEIVLSGTLAQRPVAGVANRIYYATDQASGSRFTFDNGTAWVGQ